jgi:hypothetical protein
VLSFSKVNVRNVIRGLDIYVLPLSAQKMTKLCDAWNLVTFRGLGDEFGGGGAIAKEPLTSAWELKQTSVLILIRPLM